MKIYKKWFLFFPLFFKYISIVEEQFGDPVARLSAEDREREFKRSKKGSSLILGFSDEDKRGTIQPYDDTLVVTLRIGGFDVRRVLEDPGNAVKVMYPDLYKGLNLRPEDLTAYDSPLISFEGKTVVPKG